MTNFVLVHGAWHGGWSYRQVAKLLRAAGHEVFTPTLTGVAERSHLRGTNINLDTHIQDIRNVIHWEDLQDVVLCGHSYGGMVITGVADAIPEKISALVYLDAFVPQNGESTMDMVSPARQQIILKGAAALGGTDAPAPDVAMFNVSEANREWVRSKLTSHPFSSVVQAIRLSGAHTSIRKRVYVWDEGRANTERFYEKCRNDPSWTTCALKGGHDAMVDEPEAVARILIDATQ